MSTYTSSRVGGIDIHENSSPSHPPLFDLGMICTRPCLLVAYSIKWFPVLFIMGVVSWSYYAYVVQLTLFTIEKPLVLQKVFYLFTYHVILILFVWSYFKTIFTNPGRVPPRWKLTNAMNDRLKSAKSEEDWKTLLELFVVEMELPVIQRSAQGAIRYCEKCQLVKPDRSHHCSVCETCIMKMDHHCPWVNNCVAYNNYKYFLLFLGYALMYCFFIIATSSPYVIMFFNNAKEMEKLGTGRFHVLILFVVSILFLISVSSLFWYHIYLVLNNRSTLEQFRAPHFRHGLKDEFGWSLGKLNNFKEVFGTRPLLWWIPINTSMGDGLCYPTRTGMLGDPENPLPYNTNGVPANISYQNGELNSITTNMNGGASSIALSSIIPNGNGVNEDNKIATEIVLNNQQENSHGAGLVRVCQQ